MSNLGKDKIVIRNYPLKLPIVNRNGDFVVFF